VVAHISLRDLRAMPGASGLEEAWVRALLGEGGYLTGKDAEAAACDAMIVPLVVGAMDASVLDQMIDLVLSAFGHRGAPGSDAHRQQCDQLREALARLAVDLVSGPNGAASILRRGLLERPWNSPSQPLDIGYSDTIPASIRRAVLWRDKYKCAWPRCGRPAAWADIHHIKHKKHGGKTSVSSCITLCQFHHDVCVHRHGWQIVLHPDGSVSAHGPDGQVQHSHSPPPTQAA
jgi:5-methylcytosine-specific restriction endonuclease McrA